MGEGTESPKSLSEVVKRFTFTFWRVLSIHLYSKHLVHEGLVLHYTIYEGFEYIYANVMLSAVVRNLRFC